MKHAQIQFLPWIEATQQCNREKKRADEIVMFHALCVFFFFCLMFVLCYASLWEAYVPSILMGGLMQRNASQGDLSLSERLKMKQCSWSSRLWVEVDQQWHRQHEGETEAEEGKGDGSLVDPGWMMSVFLWLQGCGARDWEVLKGSSWSFYIPPFDLKMSWANLPPVTNVE